MIDYYKQVERFEVTVVQARDRVNNNIKKGETLKKEIALKKEELSQLQQEAGSLKHQLKTADERLKEITGEYDEWNIEPEDLEELESEYQQLKMKTQTAGKEINEFNGILEGIKNRLTLTRIQFEFRQLKEITLRLTKETVSEKSHLKRKKELQKKIKDLESKLKNTSAMIKTIQETHGQDIEQFLLYQKESRKIKKQVTALRKKNRDLSGKIKLLKKETG